MFNIAALIPLFQSEERRKGRQDALDGEDRCPPLLGWGGYDDGYDEGEAEREDD